VEKFVLLLSYYAFGINSYEHFFDGNEPDWSKIISKKDTTNYGFVVAQTPSNFNPEKESIDTAPYKKTFKEILEYVPIDASKYKFFSITFTRTKNLKDLTKYIWLDFNQYKT
jgi:hypothetical protein